MHCGRLYEVSAGKGGVMDQLKLTRLAKEISKIYFIPWHERDRGRLKTPMLNSFPGGDDEIYRYLINEWIPGQADSAALMKLLILCEFEMCQFFKIIVTPPPGKKSVRSAA